MRSYSGQDIAVELTRFAIYLSNIVEVEANRRKAAIETFWSVYRDFKTFLETRTRTFEL